MLETSCPNCSRRLKATDEALEKRAKCARCGHVFVVDASQSEFVTKPIVSRRRRFVTRGLPVMLVFGLVIGGLGYWWEHRQKSAPTHVLLKRLERIEPWIKSLEYRKSYVTHAAQVEARKKEGVKVEPWSREEELQLETLT